MMGIYLIRNTITRRVYVGSAKHIRKRWYVHHCELSKGTSKCRKLQKSWDKYGSAAHSFEIIEVVQDQHTLIEREQFWIDSLNACRTGLNIRVRAESQLGAKRSAASRKRMSIAARNRDPSTFHRGPNGRPAWNRGKKTPPETRAKISAIQLGKKRKPHSEETKKKMSIAAKLRGVPQSVIEKAHAASRGRVQGEEERAKRSSIHKIRCNTPEFRARMSALTKARWMRGDFIQTTGRIQCK